MAAKTPKELRHWQRERDLIPEMVLIYCRGSHGTIGNEPCAECAELTEYALLRLEKCPFKKNKEFCSFCSVHCYKPDMREKIKAVMRYSGPRMLFRHPIFSMSHVAALLRQKCRQKKAAAEKK